MDLRVCFMSKPFFTAIGNIALACYAENFTASFSKFYFLFIGKIRLVELPLKMSQYNLIHTTTIQSMVNVQLIQQWLAIGMDKSGQFH